MIGETIGPYQVEALIGRGGMGEVYKAHDARLERHVALKILPADLVGDRDRLGRFEREARLLAALQHQNIANIYGLEEFDGQPVLVMELAEGEDLSKRLAAGPLDIDEVERIARQLARGLEFAHERGIVHRDLKPANLKLGGDGRVKILDFGLARVFTGAADSSSASTPAMTAATVPPDLTRPGTVLGTAAYMSPEQARGYDVDRRADIWAFGAILFEMLTGKKLFAGETASDTMAAILRQEPDYDQLPDGTPPVLVQLIRRCLQKDPQLRLRDIGEVRIALEDGSSSVVSVGSSPAGPALEPVREASRRPLLPWILVAVLTVTLGGVFSLGMSGRLESPPKPPPLVRSQVALPAGASFYLNPASPGPPMVSPDGRRLAFSALDSTGRTMLYVRSLASLDAHAIAGTENAAYLFWAPNSREIAFFSDGNLNRVDIAGGPVVPICPAENGKGGSWNTEDQILFAPTHVASVHLVAATGGEPVPVTSVEADTTARSHRFPCWLPDGRHFVYLSWRNGANSRSSGIETALRLGSTDGSVDRELMVSQTNAIYAGGCLLHVHESNLMSRPFSWRDLEFTGPPQPVLGGVLALQAAHVAVFSATDAGVLAYVAGDGIFGMSQLQWVGPAAEELDILPGTFASPQGISVAPDGKHVAVSQADERAGTYDIWVYKVGREVGARFTFANESEQNPIWTPDSRWITYAGFSPNGLAIFRKLASGAGRPEVLLDIADNCFPSGWSHDGSRLAIDRVNESGDYDIWFLDHGRTDSLQVFRATPFNEGNARFSADDRWLAYTSDETGMLEIFVESLAGDGGRYRVSSHSGLHPLWSPDGSRIYYLDTGGSLLATSVDTATGSLVIGETVTIARGLEVSRLKTHAVDASSGRLLIQRSLQDRVSDRLQLVTGWQNLLRDTSDN